MFEEHPITYSLAAIVAIALFSAIAKAINTHTRSLYKQPLKKTQTLKEKLVCILGLILVLVGCAAALGLFCFFAWVVIQVCLSLDKVW